MEIRQVTEQKTLAVNLTVPMSQLSTVIGEVYGEIAGYMGKKGIGFAGAPYVLYRNMDMEALDIEIGFPAETDDRGEGRVTPSALPAGKVVTTVHKGPYSELEKTYNRVVEYARQQNVTLKEWMYESYLNSPQDTAPEELLTGLFFPITE